MKRLADQVSFKKKLETISISDFRKQPGDVLAQVALGKTYVIQRAGNSVAVLSGVPGVELASHIGREGGLTYTLPS